MVTLTVLMGPPGSGKTTWTQNNPVPVVCSTERLRTDHTLTAGATVAYISSLQKRARRALKGGEGVLVDGCNTKRHERGRWLRIAGECGARTRLVVLDTPLATCLAVQLGRDHPVSADRVRGYHEEFTRSLAVIGTEGWDSIVRVDRGGSLPVSTAQRW